MSTPAGGVLSESSGLVVGSAGLTPGPQSSDVCSEPVRRLRDHHLDGVWHDALIGVFDALFFGVAR